MSLSNGAKTFIFTAATTVGIVWYVAWSEKEARRLMKLGPERDKLRLVNRINEEKAPTQFKDKMAEFDKADEEAAE